MATDNPEKSETFVAIVERLTGLFGEPRATGVDHRGTQDRWHAIWGDVDATGVLRNENCFYLFVEDRDHEAVIFGLSDRDVYGSSEFPRSLWLSIDGSELVVYLHFYCGLPQCGATDGHRPHVDPKPLEPFLDAVRRTLEKAPACEIDRRRRRFWSVVPRGERVPATAQAVCETDCLTGRQLTGKAPDA